MSTKTRLGAMMFLEYAIWGAWAPVLSAYLINDLHFSGGEAGFIYGLLPLATIVAPFIGGQVADRTFATEKVIGVLSFAGGLLLLIVSQTEDYRTMAGLMLVYCLVFAPTLALTNSIAMINLKDPEAEFGKIRVWGTLGWIAAGLALSGWRWAVAGGTVSPVLGDTLLLAGIFSILMGLQSFSLPHTPPRKENVRPWAFLESLKMLADRDFAVFVGITFVVSTELEFYYILTAPFLQSAMGVSEKSIPAVMTIAQLAEIFVMAFGLSWALKRYGMRRTLAIGVVAWPLRYIIFAIGAPKWLVIAALALHGFCYVFFFVAAFIYVDKVAPPDVRASAQSMIAIVALGFGRFLGSLFAGWVRDFFTSTATGTNWRMVFLVPCVLTLICAAAFLIFFRGRVEPAPGPEDAGVRMAA